MTMTTVAVDTVSTKDFYYSDDSASSYDSILEEKQKQKLGGQKRMDVKFLVTKPGGEMSAKFSRIFCKHIMGKDQKKPCAVPMLSPKETPRLPLFRDLKIWLVGSEYEYFVRSSYSARDPNSGRNADWHVWLYMWIRDRQTLDDFVRYGAPWRACVPGAGKMSESHNCSVPTRFGKPTSTNGHRRQFVYRDSSDKKRFEMTATVFIPSTVPPSLRQSSIFQVLDDEVTADKAVLFQIFEYDGFKNIVMLDAERKEYWRSGLTDVSALRAQYYSDNGLNIFHARG